MRRLASELVRYRGEASPARWERAAPPSRARRLSDSQLDTALDLMRTQALKELGKRDFGDLGRKYSWTELGMACAQRFAIDMLEELEVDTARPANEQR